MIKQAWGWRQECRVPSKSLFLCLFHRENVFSSLSWEGLPHFLHRWLFACPGISHAHVHLIFCSIIQRRREEIRRQRIESEQRRRDELRDGYAKLKFALPISNQKSSKVSLLDRGKSICTCDYPIPLVNSYTAVTYIRQLETSQSSLQTRLDNAENELTRLRKFVFVLPADPSIIMILTGLFLLASTSSLCAIWRITTAPLSTWPRHQYLRRHPRQPVSLPAHPETRRTRDQSYNPFEIPCLLQRRSPFEFVLPTLRPHGNTSLRENFPQ